RIQLFLEDTDGNVKEMPAQDVTLPLTSGNEVTLTADAPDKPGEVKVKVVIDKPDGDKFPLNNSIETFASVSKEGISVLLVDRWRQGEPQAICDVLAEDPRVRVTPLFLTGKQPLPGSNAAKIFAEDATPF